MNKVTDLTEYRIAIARKQTRIHRARGELNEDQFEAVCRLMRKLLKSKQARSVCEACDLAMERLGFD